MANFYDPRNQPQGGFPINPMQGYPPMQQGNYQQFPPQAYYPPQGYAQMPPGVYMGQPQYQGQMPQPYMNMNYQEGAYQAQPFQKEQPYSKPTDDILCADHKKLKPDRPYFTAERFCTRCNYLVCEICVLEFHSDHIAEAKTQVEVYCYEKKSEIEAIKASNNKILQSEDFLNQIQAKENDIKNTIKKFLIGKKNYAESLIKKLEFLCKELSDLETKLFIDAESFFKDDFYIKLERPRDNLKKGILIINIFRE